MSYLYLKNSQKRFPPRGHQLRRHKKYLAAVFFTLGFFLFASALLPIIQFQLEYSIKFNQIINPLSSKFYNQPDRLLANVDGDYTQLSNWFVPDSRNHNFNLAQPIMALGNYHLSIPSLRIEDALVEVGSLDLKKSLIQYAQTAFPGQLGNTVIFGHSVLPQFFNPKSYMTIFSTLYKLKPGDEVYINYDNIRYKYLVEELFEVPPSDLSVLEQRFDDRYLTLITCSPPGTYLRRLIVRARIVNI